MHVSYHLPLTPKQIGLRFIHLCYALLDSPQLCPSSVVRWSSGTAKFVLPI